MALTFGVLGPLRVWDGDGGVIEGLRPAHRRLLAILLLDAGRTVHTSRLIDRFWTGRPPATAKTALQTHISSMRRLLPDGVIVTEHDGYAVCLEGAEVDAEVVAAAGRSVEALMEHGRHAQAVSTSSEALDRWRGRSWEELEDDEFAAAEISRLEELRLGLLERRAEARLACGREAEALAELEGLVDEHPLRERLWEHLVVARQRLGRHADAVRALRAVELRLAELGLEPGDRLRELEHRVLTRDHQLEHPAPNGLGGTRGFPVHHTSFIGRHQDLERVDDLLDQHRLVTLTGVGGCGKTRLAVETARRWERGADGAFFVDLAPLGDPELVPAAVAHALGVHQAGARPPGPGTTWHSLVQALTGRRWLLVLDNCEHLLDACAELAEELLRSCTGLRLLATSREPLGVDGEQVHRVPSLSLPDTGTATPAGAGSDAVALFLDRATASCSDFAPRDEEHVVIADICRRLDGIPLAIEFAAARTAHLTPHGIAERLDDRFRLLTGGRRRVRRQQTLEATLDWSHDLLAPRERAVLRRLAVFAGSFGLEMAEAVCTDDDIAPAAVLDALGALVDQSLVVVDRAPGATRYRLLETVRAYAETKLHRAGEAERVRSAHRDAYVDWLESTRWGTPYFDAELLDRMVRELSNLRAALEWSWAQGRADLVARLGARAHILWQPGVGHGPEGRRWMERAIGCLDEIGADHRTACWLAMAEADFTLNDPVQEEHARRAIEAGEPLDGLLVQAYGIRAIGAATRSIATRDPGAASLARSCADDGVRAARDFGDGWLMHALLSRGEVLVVLGDLEAAERSYSAAAELSRPAFHYHHALAAELATCRLLLGNPEGALEVVSAVLEQRRSGRPTPWTHLVAAVARVRVGDRAAAATEFEEAVSLVRSRPVFLEMNECLLYAAAMAHDIGETCRAASLLAAATSTGDAAGAPVPFRSPAGWALYRHHVAEVRRELGPDCAHRCREEGRAMELDDAVGAARAVAAQLQGRPGQRTFSGR